MGSEAAQARRYQNKGRLLFYHIIGLPTKEGREKPLFDYYVSICNRPQ
jgi:hypothetical protein